MPSASGAAIRQAISVQGVVQGVGFRPFVYGLAKRFALGGFVRNTAGCVQIEVEGDAHAIGEFLLKLRDDAPPQARVETVACHTARARGELAFRIEPSGTDAGPSTGMCITPDVATCDACLRELFDPADRRHAYPFVNCAHCGPRLTILTRGPYDRARTTMAPFAMCDACRAEYEDPSNRRFHAQPIACPDCGPQLRVVDSGNRPLSTDPIGFAVGALLSGRIVAVKGLGGYHLACSARLPAAVAELRRRKGRYEKPFAILVRDLAAARDLCDVSAEEQAALESAARPIVLLRRKSGADVAAAVAPDAAWLGVMLPYSPLHHLLVRHLGDAPLVLTSGNRSDEPIAYEDADALVRLGSIADVWLTHDRPIHVRCDDSVVRVLAAPRAPAPTPLRRARGMAPLPVSLPQPAKRPILAAGAHLKSTFAIGTGDRAYVSHHFGDLDDYAALKSYADGLVHFENLLRLQPEVIVHDAHPDFTTTREAVARARATGAELISVQHHHAHMASCMVDSGLRGEAIGVCFDGAGLGEDGAIWGGELLVGGYAEVRRAGHFAYLPMPGGERAAREPWRMAVALLLAAGEDPGALPLASRVSRPALDALVALSKNGSTALCPPTSSVGRLFDAVASLAGLCDLATYEGQAAMALEGAALGEAPGEPYPVDVFEESGQILIDARALARAVAADVRSGTASTRIARRFHDALADATVRACVRIRAQEHVEDVVLSGGVFVNGVLFAEVARRLEEEAFRVHVHRHVPPNDGGLSLGQLAVGIARLAKGTV